MEKRSSVVREKAKEERERALGRRQKAGKRREDKRSRDGWMGGMNAKRCDGWRERQVYAAVMNDEQ